MTPLQIELVRVTWQRVLPIRATAADLFYARLFELAPDVRPMFKRDVAAQGAMLMATLDMIVGRLDRLADAVPAAERLACRHLNYGVQPQHYDTVGEALLWTLAQGLGDDFTPAAQEAWRTAYTMLADAMKRAAYPEMLQAQGPDRAPEPALSQL